MHAVDELLLDLDPWFGIGAGELGFRWICADYTSSTIGNGVDYFLFRPPSSLQRVPLAIS